MITKFTQSPYARNMKKRAEHLLAILTAGGPEKITVSQVALIVDIATRIFGEKTIDTAIQQQRAKSKAREEGMCTACTTRPAAEKEKLCNHCLNLFKRDLAALKTERFEEKPTKKIVH